MHAIRSRGENEQSDTLAMTLEDMTFALQVIQPSAMREVAIEIPQVLKLLK